MGSCCIMEDDDDGRAGEDENHSLLEEPLTAPTSPSKVVVLMSTPDLLEKRRLFDDEDHDETATETKEEETTTKSNGNVQREQQVAVAEILATTKNGPVLDKLFSSGRNLVENATVQEHGSRGRKRLLIKSYLYMLLNPRSRQLPAVYFKWFISFVIVVDFIVFVISTEPIYRQQRRNAEIFQAVEGVTSSIFLLEYLARLYTTTESKKYGPHGPVMGRLYSMLQYGSVVDLFATLPFFLELSTGWELPQLTYLRTFRLLRILKANGFVQATDAVWRVLYYNRQIMYMSVFVGLFMILTTSILMFYLRPRKNVQTDDFESMLSTMYLSTLILTGSSSVSDLPELPWYTKGVVLLTSAFSIGRCLCACFCTRMMAVKRENDDSFNGK